MKIIEALMITHTIGKPHVVRSSTVGKNIISSNLALHEYVKKNVFKFIKGKSCSFVDDLISETFIDIAEYSKRFDSTKNISPETFINLRLKGSIVDNYIKYLQSVKTPRNNRFENDEGSFFHNSFYNSINPMFFGESEDDDYIEKSVEEDFKNSSQESKINKLDIIEFKNEVLDFVKFNFKENDQKIFHMRFIEEKSQTEIAKILKKTSAAISDREKKIKEKISKKFPNKLKNLAI